MVVGLMTHHSSIGSCRPEGDPAVGLGPLVLGVAVPSATGNTAVEYFVNRVRPLLAEKRFLRHAQARKGDLEIRSRYTLVGVGHCGLAIEPRALERSLPTRAVRHSNGRLRMLRRVSSRRRGLRSLQIGSMMVRLGAPAGRARLQGTRASSSLRPPGGSRPLLPPTQFMSYFNVQYGSR